MFEKMIKLRNRKAFTLVEMLVVIAIIAILVAIIVPIVGHSVQKSRAATNAANLRSIEGKLSTLRVERPDLFEDAIDRMGEPFDSLYEGGLRVIEDLFGTSLEEILANNEALAEFATYSVYHSTADGSGKLVLQGEVGNPYELEGVPAAVAVSVGGTTGMEVAEGTPMTVYVSPTGIVATYEYNGVSYTRNDFAEVAETGEFNGTASGGSTKEDVRGGALENVQNKINCTFGDHVPGDNCVCIYCGEEAHKGFAYEDSTYHICSCGEREEHNPISIINTTTCACGATRTSKITWTGVKYGDWTDPESH